MELRDRHTIWEYLESVGEEINLRLTSNRRR